MERTQNLLNKIIRSCGLFSEQDLLAYIDACDNVINDQLDRLHQDTESRVTETGQTIKQALAQNLASFKVTRHNACTKLQQLRGKLFFGQ